MATPLKIPKGLEALLATCSAIYPDQKNPIQVTTILKYWLGGIDPLDYISIYDNKGDNTLNIPAHWHYISFGFSDLHGDGRVHSNNEENRSGMGFELTFRLKKTTEEIEKNVQKPPTWPANLLQSLAKYVFQTGNTLFCGDNIPWKKSLNENKPSCIKHMLIAEDIKLKNTMTPFGSVEFLQIVGVTDEELEQAARWNGKGVLNLLKLDESTGGDWLITDMNRSKSVFTLFPNTLVQLELDLEREGSDLAGIDAEFEFKEIENVNKINPIEDIAEELRTTNIEVKTEVSDNDIRPPLLSSKISIQPTYLTGVELKFSSLAAKYLFLAMHDRIRHGRHFTFKNINTAVTFVAESVTGSYCTKSSPFVLLGYWLQVLIPDKLLPDIVNDFKKLESLKINDEENKSLPITFEYPSYGLKILVGYVPSTPDLFY